MSLQSVQYAPICWRQTCEDIRWTLSSSLGTKLSFFTPKWLHEIARDATSRQPVQASIDLGVLIVPIGSFAFTKSGHLINDHQHFSP